MTLPPPAKSFLEALAAGDRRAYGSLYDRLGDRLLRVAAAMLRSTADSEDAVQDLFVNLARSRQRFLAVEDLDAYVFACLRHAIGAKLARAKSEESHLRRMAMQVTGAYEPAPSDREDVAAALDSLPADQREMVSLKIDGGLTFAQIAGVLDISPNTAASRYRYALEKLRQRLGEQP